MNHSSGLNEELSMVHEIISPKNQPQIFPDDNGEYWLFQTSFQIDLKHFQKLLWIFGIFY